MLIILYYKYDVMVENMAIISVRIDDKLKKEMDKLKHINWSEVIRQAIVSKLRDENNRNLAKAVLLTERVRKKASDGWDTTEIIRHWREYRFRESGS